MEAEEITGEKDETAEKTSFRIHHVRVASYLRPLACWVWVLGFWGINFIPKPKPFHHRAHSLSLTHTHKNTHLARGSQSCSCAICIRLPHVSSNMATVTLSISVGSRVNFTPRFFNRSYSSCVSSTVN